MRVGSEPLTSLCWFVRIGKLQFDSECSSLVDARAMRTKNAAVGINNRLGNCQTETEAAKFSRHGVVPLNEGFKYSRARFHRKSDTGVRHFHDEMCRYAW